MALLELDKLTLDFGGLRALSELDLQVDQGEIVSVIGPNGAGKSTVFNVITGIYEPTGGAVRFDGRVAGRAKAPPGDANSGSPGPSRACGCS